MPHFEADMYEYIVKFSDRNKKLNDFIMKDNINNNTIEEDALYKLNELEKLFNDLETELSELM